MVIEHGDLRRLAGGKLLALSPALVASTLSNTDIMTLIFAGIAALGTLGLVLGLPSLSAWRIPWKVHCSASPFEVPLTERRTQVRRWHVELDHHTILPRIQAPIFTRVANPDVATVNRRRFRRWLCNYAPPKKAEVAGGMLASNIAATRPANLPETTHGPRVEFGNYDEIGIGESQWFYVTN